MAAGLGLLGHPPAVFWAMTPKELDAALRGKLGPVATFEAPSEKELAGLMQLFPDNT